MRKLFADGIGAGLLLACLFIAYVLIRCAVLCNAYGVRYNSFRELTLQ